MLMIFFLIPINHLASRISVYHYCSKNISFYYKMNKTQQVLIDFIHEIKILKINKDKWTLGIYYRRIIYIILTFISRNIIYLNPNILYLSKIIHLHLSVYDISIWNMIEEKSIDIYFWRWKKKYLNKWTIYCKQQYNTITIIQDIFTRNGWTTASV